MNTLERVISDHLNGIDPLYTRLIQPLGFDSTVRNAIHALEWTLSGAHIVSYSGGWREALWEARWLGDPWVNERQVAMWTIPGRLWMATTADPYKHIFRPVVGHLRTHLRSGDLTEIDDYATYLNAPERTEFRLLRHAVLNIQQHGQIPVAGSGPFDEVFKAEGFIRCGGRWVLPDVPTDRNFLRSPVFEQARLLHQLAHLVLPIAAADTNASALCTRATEEMARYFQGDTTSELADTLSCHWDADAEENFPSVWGRLGDDPQVESAFEVVAQATAVVARMAFDNGYTTIEPPDPVLECLPSVALHTLHQFREMMGLSAPEECFDDHLFPVRAEQQCWTPDLVEEKILDQPN